MTVAQIFKMLNPFVSRSGVFNVLKRFRDIGSYLPLVRSTIPSEDPKVYSCHKEQNHEKLQRSERKNGKRGKSESYDNPECVKE